MAAATIVFCDIVGFSQLSDSAQEEAVFELNRVISHVLYRDLHNPSPSVTIISLSTGDGVALAFIHQDNPASFRQVRDAAFSVTDGLMKWSRPPSPLQLRIGIHEGTVILIGDINHRVNVCGVTVNDSQRVMNAAHPNQVLISGAAFERLVGRGKNRYDDPPFSKESHATFNEPLPVVAKHGKVIEACVMTRSGKDGWGSNAPAHAGIIYGRVERTRFIVESLKALRKTRGLHICEQSAMSSFAILPRSQWSGDSKEYLELLQQQRDLLEEVIERKETRFQLLLYPNHSSYDSHRCRALLKWLRKNQSNARVGYCIGGSGGPNRLIIRGRFSIEGYKNHDKSGYELSIVYSGNDIQKPQVNFDEAFEQAEDGKSTKEWKVRTIKAIEGILG